MPDKFTTLGAPLGVNLDHAYTNAEQLKVYGFNIDDTVVAGDETYKFTKNGNTAIAANNSVTATGISVPANAHYWRKSGDL